MSSAGRCQDALGPNVAGTWYPANAQTLAEEVDSLLSRAERETRHTGTGRPAAALVSPHAGFVYSGAVAAHGFLSVREAAVERVVLLGPSHYAAFRGAVVPRASTYRTPLGDVPIDTDAIAHIESDDGIRVDDTPFTPEHCLEAEIPFLQRCLPAGFKIVPVLIGGGSEGETARSLAEGLEPLLGPDTLLVASSDFTHYGAPFGYVPFEDRVPERLRELDMGAVDAIIAGDVEGFEAYVSRTGATICGRDAISVLLRLLPRDSAASLAAYDTSGRMTGTWDHSVSYASLVFARNV